MSTRQALRRVAVATTATLVAFVMSVTAVPGAAVASMPTAAEQATPGAPATALRVWQYVTTPTGVALLGRLQSVMSAPGYAATVRTSASGPHSLLAALAAQPPTVINIGGLTNEGVRSVELQLALWRDPEFAQLLALLREDVAARPLAYTSLSSATPADCSFGCILGGVAASLGLVSSSIGADLTCTVGQGVPILGQAACVGSVAGAAGSVTALGAISYNAAHSTGNTPPTHMVMPSAACPSATHCQGTAFIDSNDVDTSPTATGATFDVVCWREGPVSSALLLPITGASFEYCPNDLAQYVGHGYTIASSVSDGDFNGSNDPYGSERYGFDCAHDVTFSVEVFDRATNSYDQGSAYSAKAVVPGECPA